MHSYQELACKQLKFFFVVIAAAIAITIHMHNYISGVCNQVIWVRLLVVVDDENIRPIRTSTHAIIKLINKGARTLSMFLDRRLLEARIRRTPIGLSRQYFGKN